MKTGDASSVRVKVVTVNRESKQVLVGDTKGGTRCARGDTELKPSKSCPRTKPPKKNASASAAEQLYLQ